MTITLEKSDVRTAERGRRDDSGSAAPATGS